MTEQAHDPEMTDRRGMRVMDYEECMERIRGCEVGRVGFFMDGEVVILPVNHDVDGVDVVFRSTWGSKLALAANVGRAAFEVDGPGEGLHTGWSVLVQGTAAVVDDRSESDKLDRNAARPWIHDGARTFWIRVHPHQVTGREILAD